LSRRFLGTPFPTTTTARPRASWDRHHHHQDPTNLAFHSLAPYERRVIELLRNSKDKRARKLAKKRLGTFGRGKRKVDEMTRVIAESKRAGH
jgi:hypothetical protein